MKSHRILSHRLLIDFQHRSSNCYRFISIGIDFDQLTNSLIAYARGKTLKYECMYCMVSLSFITRLKLSPLFNIISCRTKKCDQVIFYAIGL